MLFKKMAEQNKILVTGYSGFIGSYVVKLLIEKKHIKKIYLAGRKQELSRIETLTTQKVRFDISEPVDLNLDADIVIHIAGEKKNEAQMWNVNYEGTKRLLAWAARAQVRKFIYVSSVGVYGASRVANSINENSKCYPQNTYEQSKNAAEQLVKKFCERNNIDFVILQPSNVIGLHKRGFYPLLGLARAVKRGFFCYFGKKNVFLNYIDVRDVAAGIVASIDSRANNKTFILNTSCTLQEMVEIIAKNLGVRTPILVFPRLVGFFICNLGSLVAYVLRKPFPINRSRYNEMTNKSVYDGKKITEDLGFVYPIGIEAGLQNLINGYQKDGLL